MAQKKTNFQSKRAATQKKHAKNRDARKWLRNSQATKHKKYHP